jgi:hypothetical protein
MDNPGTDEENVNNERGKKRPTSMIENNSNEEAKTASVEGRRLVTLA